MVMGVLFVSCVLSGSATEWIPIVGATLGPSPIRPRCRGGESRPQSNIAECCSADTDGPPRRRCCPSVANQCLTLTCLWLTGPSTRSDQNCASSPPKQFPIGLALREGC